MKDILIIAHFTQVPGEKGNGRFHYLAERLSQKKVEVEVITSSFSHRTKKKRENIEYLNARTNYKITLIKEPDYKKNISFKRFYSHNCLAKNLKRYLDLRKKPDVIYCAVPSLDVAKVAAEYCNKHKIKLIIDVQDLWPEAFKMVFKIKYISNLIFYPLEKKAEYIYSKADEIIAVSQTYLNFVLKKNTKKKNGRCIFLGTDLNSYKNLSQQYKLSSKPSEEIWIAYIGTLGHSYDIPLIIDALDAIAKKGVNNIKFLVIGDGPLKQKFENYALNKNVEIMFTGRLEYGEMIGHLNECDIAVNPIVSGSAGSIINKVGDYAAAGIPVVNTQESLEYQKLIEDYNCGFNCENGNREDVESKLMMLIKNEALRKEMGLNSRLLAEEKFDRQKTYNQIIDILIKI